MSTLGSAQRAQVVVDTSGSRHARLRSLPLSDVRLTDRFWEPRRCINREETLYSQYEHIEETGRLDNFRRASGKVDASYRGLYFNDSDVYKWLEAASWSLATDPDPDLERIVDAAITEIADAQRPDGYLNTYFTFERANERWTNFDLHEMYCAGHLLQAAVAHFRATGRERLLDVAICFADHICEVFGPEAHGKRLAVDGHEEIEMALVELYRVTGEHRYLEQAGFFVDARGHGLLGEPYGRFDPSYSQDHEPFREQDEVVGHAVRALYLYSGAADLHAETGETELLEALERLWLNMTTKRMYVSGGLGSRHEGEAFGADYELPNGRAYAETCAAIASVMWNWRMLMISGDARYADLMEHTLYNAVLPGVSLEGRHYFYQNPLADEGTHRRQPWFGCACCPPNVARLLASLPGYFYGVSDDAAWVHLYAEGSATVDLGDRVVRLTQRTHYPWDGDVEIQVGGDGEFGLMLRVPSWCERGYAVEVNGEALDVSLSPGSYAEIRRTWQTGDTVRLRLPTPVRFVECHPCVAENVGRVALMRGPLLYCVEQSNTPGFYPRDLVVPVGSEPSVRFEPDLLGGVMTMTFGGEVAAPGPSWENRLYRPLPARPDDQGAEAVVVKAVPYYAWANREPGVMRVWLRSR
jgi:uncharacterized protein